MIFFDGNWSLSQEVWSRQCTAVYTAVQCGAVTAVGHRQDGVTLSFMFPVPPSLHCSLLRTDIISGAATLESTLFVTLKFGHLVI